MEKENIVISPVLNDRIFRASRSLFRYALLITQNSPKILIEQEEKILIGVFRELEAPEILYLVGYWQEIAKQQAIDMGLLDKFMDNSVKSNLKNLN